MIGNTSGIVEGFGSVGNDIEYNVALNNCAAGLILGTGPATVPPPQADSNFVVSHNWVEQNGGPCEFPGLYTIGGQNGTLSNNFVLNNPLTGIGFGDAGAGWPASTNWQVRDNIITNNKQTGVWIQSRSSGIVLEENQIANNGNNLAVQVVVDPSAAEGINSDWSTTNTVSYAPSPPNPPAPSIAGIVNAASEQTGGIAPGEVLAIYGTNLGPAQLTSAAPSSDGRFERILAGTRVLFDGVPGAMWYTSAGQVAVIVPYYLYWKDSTSVQVEYSGVKSAPIAMTIQQSQPAIFTQNASGGGAGDILNQDYTVNTAANPAARGSVVILYATGEGQSDPAGCDGLLANTVLPQPRLPVSVTIGGGNANVLYAGAAPTFVAGALQINVTVPPSAPIGATVPIQISVGGVLSPTGVTLAVK